MSFYGACLHGIECLKGPGDIVEIKYKRKACKFRVVWVGAPGTKEHGHIGLRSLEPRKNIWSMKEIPAPSRSQPLLDSTPRAATAVAGPRKPAAEKPETSGPERRSYTRYRCGGTVEFRIAGNCTTMSGTLTDVSLGGCHVQVAGTCLPGTRLELALEACNQRIHLDGRAAAAESTKGMCIEFVSGCNGLKQLPKFIEAVRRSAKRVPARSATLPRLQPTKSLP